MSASFQSPSFVSRDHHAHLLTDNCPWCEQPIPHDKFESIKSRIEADERKRADDLAKQLKSQFAEEKANDAAKAKAGLEQIQKSAAATIETMQKDFLVKEATIRDEAKKVAEAALQAKLQAAEQEARTLKEVHEKAVAEQLLKQREALEKAASASLNAERAKAFGEKQKLETKLQEVQRQLQNKTAQELGEGAEVDLYEALKEEFPHDNIDRVSKGSAGADLIHTVIHNGKTCGVIVYDSKNRNAWRNEFVTKLRADQISANADHAILSTLVFPAGAHQLDVREGVIVTNPARVLALVQLLRKHILQIHTMRLSNEARDQKTVALYEFITSERCGMFLQGIEQRAHDMLELDVKEQTAHKNTWARRGQLLREVQKMKNDLTFEIDQIIGTAAEVEELLP